MADNTEDTAVTEETVADVAPTPYAFTEEDRRGFDTVLQEVRSDAATNALFEAVRYLLKHDLAGLHMAVGGYGELLDRAEEHLAASSQELRRATELMLSIVERVASLETKEQYATISREDFRKRIRDLEHRVTRLEAGKANGMTDGPGD